MVRAEREGMGIGKRKLVGCSGKGVGQVRVGGVVEHRRVQEVVGELGGEAGSVRGESEITPGRIE